MRKIKYFAKTGGKSQVSPPRCDEAEAEKEREAELPGFEPSETAESVRTSFEAVWQQEDEPGKDADKTPQPPITDSLQSKIDRFKKMLGNADDVKSHKFLFGSHCEYQAALLYVDGLIDHKLIVESVMKPLTEYKDYEKTFGDGKLPTIIDIIKNAVLSNDDISQSKDYGFLVENCLNGNTILLLNDSESGLVIGTKGWEFRKISEPQTEAVVRGPREGFTENFRTNTSLIRRKIKSTALRIENLKVGRKTNTDVCIVYLENVVQPNLVATVKERIKNVDVDSLLETGYLEEYIEDNPYSIFTTIGYTEKPDVAAAKILEGRVAVVVDGTPFVLTMPMMFIESFQSAEDYYNRPLYVSVTRIMRLLSYIIAVFSLPVFIAFTTFHQEFLPSTLLFTIANAREGTPFPVFLEGLIMIVAFEILREAGLRLPRPVGQAISIVGALVMGEAAVSAGLVGTPIVITVAISAVAGFTIPFQADTISITRILMMLLAAFLGGFGISIGFLALLIHLSKLKSFGSPYFSSVNPTSDMQDSIIRMPLWSMVKRPVNIAGNDKNRRVKKIPPVPEATNAPKN